MSFFVKKNPSPKHMAKQSVINVVIWRKIISNNTYLVHNLWKLEKWDDIKKIKEIIKKNAFSFKKLMHHTKSSLKL